MTTKRNVECGFSLVDTLIAIGVIALLIALMLPAVQQSREASRRLACRNQMHQLGLAMANYSSQFHTFPPGGVVKTRSSSGAIPRADENTDGRAAWTVLILPQLDEGAKYNSFNMEGAFSCLFDKRSKTLEPNLTHQYSRLRKYRCPSDPNSDSAGLVSNYAACQGGGKASDAAGITISQFPRLFYDNGMFFHNSSTKPADILDGMSNTVMIGETKYVGSLQGFASTGAWWPWSASIRGDESPNPAHASFFNISATVDPINFPQNSQYTEADIVRNKGVFQGCGHGGQQRVYGSWHKHGGHFLMADGAIHFLSENMDLKIYRSLGNKSDGGPSSFVD